jgi:hypothetical protein
VKTENADRNVSAGRRTARVTARRLRSHARIE